MLGWGFIVKVPEIVEAEPIPYWESPYDTWLQDAVSSGDADVLSKAGGYPDRYVVKTEVLPDDKVLNKPDIEWCIVEVWDLS